MNITQLSSSHNDRSIVTGSRAVNTSYENTSGKYLLVIVCGRDTNQAGGLTYMRDSNDDFLADDNIICQMYSKQMYDATNRGSRTLIGMIPPDYYYKVDGALSMESWVEIELG